MTEKLTQLSERSKDLSLLITKLEVKYETPNFEQEYRDAKKDFYENKLEMIHLMDSGVDKVTVTARQLRNRVRSTPRPPRYETGIFPLDRALDGGIEIGSLVLLAGQSFVGKTHITIEILSNVCKYNKAVFYNFEMGDNRIVDKLETLLETDTQWDNLILNSEDNELGALCADISLHAKQGVKYFAIDSRMKVRVKGNDPEYLKISSTTRELARVAQKHDIIIFLINQLSNESIKEGRLTFKGSGDAIYDTDLAFFYLKDEKTGERALVCNKNRQVNGREFKIKLTIDAKGRTIEHTEHIYPAHEKIYEHKESEYKMEGSA